MSVLSSIRIVSVSQCHLKLMAKRTLSILGSHRVRDFRQLWVPVAATLFACRNFKAIDLCSWQEAAW